MDDFASNDNRWFTIPEDDSSALTKEIVFNTATNKYKWRLRSKVKGAWYWVAVPRGNRSDDKLIMPSPAQVVVEAEVTEATGPVYILILYRVKCQQTQVDSCDANQGYRIGFGSDNGYEMAYVFKNAGDAGWRSEEIVGAASALPLLDDADGSSGTLEVIVQGATFTLKAGDQVINEAIIDDRIRYSGMVGIGVLLPQANQSATVEFNRVLVDN